MSQTSHSHPTDQHDHSQQPAWLRGADWAALDKAARAAGRPPGWLAELRSDPFVEATIEAAFQIGAAGSARTEVK